MECKYRSICPVGTGMVRINRNIMECKLACQTVHGDRTAGVLIETLWNVNTNSQLPSNDSGSVLIETLWNVNSFAIFLLLSLNLY